MKRKDTLKRMIVIAMFLTIEVILCFMPMVGAIKIGPIDATFAFVPVIILAIIEGPLAGGILGFVAGLCSFIYWTFIDPGNPTAILFTPFNAFGNEIGSYWSIVICFIPRTLIGFVTGWAYRLFSNLIKKPGLLKDICCYVVSALLGSFTNTILVLFGTIVLWGKKYAIENGVTMKELFITFLGITFTNGIIEGIICAILAFFICRVIVQYVYKRNYIKENNQSLN